MKICRLPRDGPLAHQDNPSSDKQALDQVRTAEFVTFMWIIFKYAYLCLSQVCFSLLVSKVTTFTQTATDLARPLYHL